MLVVVRNRAKWGSRLGRLTLAADSCRFLSCSDKSASEPSVSVMPVALAMGVEGLPEAEPIREILALDGYTMLNYRHGTWEN